MSAALRVRTEPLIRFSSAMISAFRLRLAHDLIIGHQLQAAKRHTPLICDLIRARDDVVGVCTPDCSSVAIHGDALLCLSLWKTGRD